MRPLLVTALLALLVLLLIACAGSGSREDAPERVVERAKTEGRKVVLDFWGEKCAPCRKMDKDTSPDPRVQAALTDYVFLKIDVAEHTEFTASYGISGIPQIVVLDESGKEIARARSYQSPEAILTLLTRHK